MTQGSCLPKNQDAASHWKPFVLSWGLPIAGMLASAYLFPGFNVFVWPVALSWMGIACLRNAARCKRVHCYYTGPFFLLMAALSLGHGTGILSWGNDGWETLGMLTMIGGGLLWYVPETIHGRYASPRN